MWNIYACAIILLLGYLQEVAGNGRMVIPPQRSSLWRDRTQWRNYRLPRNYNDHTLDCGGLWKRDMYGGKCGVCGDPWDAPEPRPNEAGGMYARGIIARKYTTDVKYIDVEIEVTSSMLGYFEFNICANNDVNHRVTEECLEENPMLVLSKDRVVTYGRRYYPDIRPGAAGVVQLLLEKPKGLECTQCVLRWRWRGGNNYGICMTGGWGKGCGKQNEIYNCADISILPSESGQRTTKNSIKTTTAPNTTLSTTITHTSPKVITTTEEITTPKKTTTTEAITTPEVITTNEPISTTEPNTTTEPITTSKVSTPAEAITSSEKTTTTSENTTTESTAASETITTTDAVTSVKAVTTTVTVTTEEIPISETEPEPTPKENVSESTTMSLSTTTDKPIVTSTMIKETTLEEGMSPQNTTLGATTGATPMANMTKSSMVTDTTKSDSTSTIISLSTTTDKPETDGPVTEVIVTKSANNTEVLTTVAPLTKSFTDKKTDATTQMPKITAIPSSEETTNTAMSEQTTTKLSTHPSDSTFVPITNETDASVFNITTQVPTNTTTNSNVDDKVNQSSTKAPVTTAIFNDITNAETQTTKVNKETITEVTTEATSKTEQNATIDTITSAKPFVDGSTISPTMPTRTEIPNASVSSNVTVNITTPAVSSTTTVAASTDNIFDIDFNIPNGDSHVQPVDVF